MLVELLTPAGPDLARRWVAALLTVDRQDREALVSEVERRVAAAYGGGANEREVDVRHPPAQKDGYVEQLVTTYAEVKAPAAQAKPAGKRRAR
jgi:hypothetical protein